MPVSFGEVDQRRLAGLSRVLAAGVQQAEQEAMLEHQRMVEKDYMQKAQNAAVQFGEAMRIAESNPIAANQRVLGITAGLSASRDPRLHKLAESYVQRKFPVINRVQKRDIVKTPGYTDAERLEIGPAPGILTDVKVIGGKKTETDADLALKTARTKESQSRTAKYQHDVTGKTDLVKDLPKVQDAYRSARENLASLTKTYPIEQLNVWANILEKSMPPEQLKRVITPDSPEAWGKAIAEAMQNESTRKALEGMDAEKLRKVVEFIRYRANESALRGSLKDRNVMYDPTTDSFIPYKAAPVPTKATVIDAESWAKSVLPKK